MFASIIINTFNRVDFLRTCLRSLQRQTYPALEVVVVQGPCDDNTEALCRDYAGKIKHIFCDQVNLAYSRNIGVLASSGEVCAFIDDDSVAHPRWVENLIGGYSSSESVVGVGGYTYDVTGTQYQSKASLCDRRGDVESLLDASLLEAAIDNPVVTDGLFPSLLGTNSSFRRSAILEVGGFDEVFAYYLEETDLCLRLSTRGGVIKTVPSALVYHRYAESHIRGPDNIQKSRYFPTRSKVYFCLKHQHQDEQPAQTSQFIAEYVARTKSYNLSYKHLSRASESEIARLNQETDAGLRDGFDEHERFKANGHRSVLHEGRPSEISPPCRYPTAPAKISVVFIERSAWGDGEFPPFTHMLMRALIQAQFDVHLVCEAQSGRHNTTFWNGELWIHAVKPDASIAALIDAMPSNMLSHPNIHWSVAAYSQVVRLEHFGPQIISAPIQDAYGIAAVLFSKHPVVTLVDDNTTSHPLHNNRSRELIAAEYHLLAKSTRVIAQSLRSAGELRRLYGLDIESKTFIPRLVLPTKLQATDPDPLWIQEIAHLYADVANSQTEPRA